MDRKTGATVMQLQLTNSFVNEWTITELDPTQTRQDQAGPGRRSKYLCARAKQLVEIDLRSAFIPEAEESYGLSNCGP